VPAAATIANNTTTYSRRPAKDLRHPTGREFALDTFPNYPMDQAKQYARPIGPQVILVTLLHFHDIPSEHFRRVFGFRILVTLGAAAFPGGPCRDGTAEDATTAAHLIQDLQFPSMPRTIRSRNRPAKQVGNQRWLNQHSMNRGSTRQSVLCAVSASPECLMNRGELHRLRTGSPAHCPRPSGSGSTSSLARRNFYPCRSNPLS